MVRTSEHKFIRSGTTGRDLIFDLTRDPLECENRIADPAYDDVVHDLREALYRWALVDAAAPTYLDPAAPQIGSSSPVRSDRSALRAFFASKIDN